MKLRNRYTGEVVVCGEGIIEFKTFGCKNLAEFLESGWEDYAPTAPLIKDEKIRKAVRAWAEAVDTNSAYVEKGCYENDQFVLSDEMAEIHFRISTPEGIRFYKRYTIAELCGEEKE